MGNNNGGTPTAGASASAKHAASPYRYIPATLASVLLISLLLATGAPRLLEPWFYGLFLKAKGDPPASRTTLIVSADPGGGAMDVKTLSRLAAAILERGPAVVAIGPAAVSDPDRAEPGYPEAGDRLPRGPLVLSHGFSRFRPWSGATDRGQTLPPILARSLYPLLDGPDDGLDLAMGESPDLSDTLIAMGTRDAGAPEPSTGFAAPLGSGNIFSIPAFARLGRGVVAGLGIEAARRSLNIPAGKIGYVEGVGVLFNADHVLPIDTRGEIAVRFHGQGGIPRIPASRFLEGRVSRVEVQGRIIFVDPAAPGGPRLRTVSGPRTPTEIQASAAANFLEGYAVNAPGWGGVLPVVLSLIFIGLIVLALVLDFSVPAVFVLASLLAVSYPIIAFFVFVKSSLWLPPELPPLMVAALYCPFTLARLLAPERGTGIRPASIQPSPAYEPALMSMPGIGRPVQVGMVPGAGAAYAPSAAPARPAPRAARAEPAQASPPEPAKIRPQAPKERQGSGPVPGPERALQPSAPVPENTPVSHAEPAVPAASPAHTGIIGDDIERDSKGGLVRVGKYRIARKMGFGSGGDVFEGFDTHMGRKVAIKTITKNAATHFDRATERFVLEAKAAGSLNHPCINTIYDFGTIRDVSYMVLEFLDGITLSQWMRNNPTPPSPRAVAHWLRQIGSALDYAHGHKIIHRDLKPSNLMVVNNGATIKLLDFGIAKMEDVGLTQTGMTVGTPSYMSPEQLSGIKVGPASDQYALAVVIFQLLTYKLPYVGSKIPELCNRILRNEIIPITHLNPALGAPFWETLRKAMSRAPEDRYPNCMGLCEALEAVFPEA